MKHEETIQFCLTWNLQNKPPLSEGEVLATVKSIYTLHTSNNPESKTVDLKTSWPVLSSDALPGLVGEFVNHVCDRSEADPAAVLTTFLVRFGAECGNLSHVMVGESKHYARLFSAIVGDSSKARKGTSATPVKKVFSAIHGGSLLSKGPLSTGEGLIYAVRDELQEWVINNKTGEGKWIIKDPGITDKRLFVQEEEFASALQATKREGNTLSPILRGLWDDGDAEPLTKTSRCKTTGAHISLITHITLGELRKTLTVTEQLNGFGNRFLWVCSQRKKILPRPEQMDLKWLLDFQGRLNKITQAARMVGRMQYTPEAWELWDSEYPRLTMAYGGTAGCMVNRGEAQVVRLSLIYALLAGHAGIQIDDLQAALAFWNYCKDSALYIFGGSSTDKRKAKILEYMKSNQTMTKAEIRSKIFSNHIGGEELDAVLAEMAEEYLLEVTEEKETGGAPRTIIKKIH